jgi:transcription elongation factor GreA
MNREPLTLEGERRLREELRELKSVKRPAVIQAITEARAHGDLKENAEYHAAKEQQGFIEGRIATIEAKLSTAQIIDVSRLNPGGKVVFGSTVTLLDETTGDEAVYQIVGDIEADIANNRVSISSPLARALIGREEGDIATVQAPGGTKEYEIVSVKYI